MDLKSIYSYKAKLGYPSNSKMMVLAHVRGKYEFSPFGRVFGDVMTKGRTRYLICFESSGLVFMQVNRKGIFTNDNSFMPRNKFKQIGIKKRNWISGYYSSKQYDMELINSQHESIGFTVYKKKSAWLEKYLQTTIDNLNYYIRDTDPFLKVDNDVKNSKKLIPKEEKQSNNLVSKCKFCTHCGNKMDLEDLYCEKCGTKAYI